MHFLELNDPILPSLVTQTMITLLNNCLLSDLTSDPGIVPVVHAIQAQMPTFHSHADPDPKLCRNAHQEVQSLAQKTRHQYIYHIIIQYMGITVSYYLGFTIYQNPYLHQKMFLNILYFILMFCHLYFQNFGFLIHLIIFYIS